MYLCVIAQYSDAGCSAFRPAGSWLICTVFLWTVDKVRDAKTQAAAPAWWGRIRGEVWSGGVRMAVTGFHL